ncbi:MAG: hypothetical protein J6D44_11490 [Pseudomonas sp.]|nr:hypothetical protein [Pseudomonas sp.]
MPYPKEAVNESYKLLPLKMDSPFARINQAAIGQQESGYLVRRQYGNGPARGYWQFEEGGGVKGVMEHKASSELARSVCHARGVPFVRRTVWEALETDDVLAAAFCRLLMWTDSGKLPTSEAEGWAMYARTWRPGRPHPDKWPASWKFGLSV